MLSAAVGFAVLIGAVVGADQPAAEKSSIRIEIHGKLRNHLSAAGGETTGARVELDNMHLDLKCACDADRTFVDDENHSKQAVSVIGTVHQVKGPERGIRWVIDVEKISLRNADQKNAAKVSLVGKLTKEEKTGRFVMQTGDVAWPLELPTVKPMLEKLDGLLDKTVSLNGTPIRPEGERFTLKPLVRVDEIELFAGKMARK